MTYFFDDDKQKTTYDFFDFVCSWDDWKSNDSC